MDQYGAEGLIQEGPSAEFPEPARELIEVVRCRACGGILTGRRSMRLGIGRGCRRRELERARRDEAQLSLFPESEESGDRGKVSERSGSDQHLGEFRDRARERGRA